MNELEAFVVAANKSQATATKIKQCATQIVALAEKRGVDLGGPQGPGILRSIPDLALNPGQTQALGWMERFCEAKREPQRYAEEVALERSFGAWQDGNSTAPQTKSNRKNYLRQLLKVLRERGLPVPGNVDDVQNLEKEAGGVVSACKIMGPLTEFFEQQASTAPASTTIVPEQQWARKRGRPEEQEEEPQGLAPVAACVGPELSDEEARSALGEYVYKDFENSFFMGRGRCTLLASEAERSDTLALAPSCTESNPKEHRLVGFETGILARGDETNMRIDAFGDLMLKHGMVAAIMAVRVCAQRLCALLGVEDVEAAIGRLCDGKGAEQMVLVARPRGVYKTGPSASLTAALSVVAMMTGKRLKPSVASTGDLTLSGRVLPVGGLEEKVAVAKHHGIKTLICPLINRENDLKNTKIQGIKVVGVRSLEEAVKLAFDCPDGEVEEAQEDGPPSLSAGPPNPGVFVGAAQTISWVNRGGKVKACPMEMEVMLRPGTTRFMALNYAYETGISDIALACTWLRRYQERIVPCGSGFLVPVRREGAFCYMSTIAERVINYVIGVATLPALDITIKSDADDVIRERHLSSAVAVGLVAAITGYRYKPKAAIVAPITLEGGLEAMVISTKLDVMLMCTGQLDVVVVPKANLTEIEALRKQSPNAPKTTRFVGVDTLLEALPHLLVDYSELDKRGMKRRHSGP